MAPPVWWLRNPLATPLFPSWSITIKHIYVVDYRYYKGNIAALAKEKVLRM